MYQAYLGSTLIGNESTSAGGGGAQITDYEVEWYNWATGKNYLDSLTTTLAVSKYPLYGNKVLRVTLFVKLWGESSSDVKENVPVTMDVQFSQSGDAALVTVLDVCYDNLSYILNVYNNDQFSQSFGGVVTKWCNNMSVSSTRNIIMKYRNSSVSV